MEVDIDTLLKTISDRGMNIIGFCKLSGIERATFYNRVKRRGDWTRSEMVGVKEALHLTESEFRKIFFAKKG